MAKLSKKKDEALRKYIGSRIREMRIKKGVKATDLARRIDMSYRAVNYYELGERPISLDHLVKICEILETPMSYFLTDNKQHLKEHNEKVEQESKRETSYEFQQNMEFALELSIKHYLKSSGVPADIINQNIGTLVDQIKEFGSKNRMI